MGLWFACVLLCFSLHSFFSPPFFATFPLFRPCCLLGYERNQEHPKLLPPPLDSVIPFAVETRTRVPLNRWLAFFSRARSRKLGGIFHPTLQCICFPRHPLAGFLIVGCSCWLGFFAAVVCLEFLRSWTPDSACLSRSTGLVINYPTVSVHFPGALVSVVGIALRAHRKCWGVREIYGISHLIFSQHLW